MYSAHIHMLSSGPQVEKQLGEVVCETGPKGYQRSRSGPTICMVGRVCGVLGTLLRLVKPGTHL